MSFSHEYQFIDGQDKSARKKTRSHVTREYYRERRWQQINAFKSREEPAVLPEPSKPAFVVSVAHLGQYGNDWPPKRHRKGSHESENSGDRAPHSKGYSQPYPSIEYFEEPTGQSIFKASPMTILGAGRVDPFQTFPIEATRDIHQLVDHYHIAIPSLLHRHWGRRVTHPMPIIDLFQLYRQDAVSFLGVLHHAAHHLAKTQQGILGETPQTISFKYRSLKLLNERIAATKGRCDDGTIIAVGLLANAERVWGDKEVARMHLRALKRMILDRGGFPAFAHNHLMHTKLIWNFIALSGASPEGNPAYIDTFAESAAEECGNSTVAPRSAFLRSCEEFVRFFIDRRVNALRALPTSRSDRKDEQHFPLRTSSFRPGSRLLHALRPVDTGYSWPEKRRAVDNCRLACLIYLNAVIADYGNFSTKTEQFLGTFCRFVEDDDYDCALSAEHLLWALIRGIEERTVNERIYMISRMMGVIKRANQRTWQEVEEALRQFLVMPEDSSELIKYLQAWDPEKFRRDVMAFSENDSTTPLTDLDDNEPPFRLVFSTEDSDFLPETRDAQWFQETEAAARSGVGPHPKMDETLQRMSLSPKSQLSDYHSPEHTPGDIQTVASGSSRAPSVLDGLVVS